MVSNWGGQLLGWEPFACCVRLPSMMDTIRSRRKPINLKRCALILIASLYLVTWVWGVPSVHSKMTAETIREYKAYIADHPDATSARHPYMRFGATLVPFPFVVVHYTESGIGPLRAWGGWTVHIWWVTGSREVAGLTCWVS